VHSHLEPCNTYTITRRPSLDDAPVITCSSTVRRCATDPSDAGEGVTVQEIERALDDRNVFGAHGLARRQLHLLADDNYISPSLEA